MESPKIPRNIANLSLAQLPIIHTLEMPLTQEEWLDQSHPITVTNPVDRYSDLFAEKSVRDSKVWKIYEGWNLYNWANNTIWLNTLATTTDSSIYGYTQGWGYFSFTTQGITGALRLYANPTTLATARKGNNGYQDEVGKGAGTSGILPIVEIPLANVSVEISDKIEISY